MKAKLVIFSAPSGAGKTTIVKEVLKADIPFAFLFRLRVGHHERMKLMP